MATIWPEGRREAVCAWLTANGINPKAVPEDADITIGQSSNGRFLRCEVYRLTPDGHPHIDEHDPHRAARIVINVPLKAEPPAWWEPHVKPTRDQLLSVLDRIRALTDDGPPAGAAIGGEWEGGWESAMEAVKEVLNGSD
jgi:hypothetical protein